MDSTTSSDDSANPRACAKALKLRPPATGQRFSLASDSPTKTHGDDVVERSEIEDSPNEAKPPAILDQSISATQHQDSLQTTSVQPCLLVEAQGSLLDSAGSPDSNEARDRSSSIIVVEDPDEDHASIRPPQNEPIESSQTRELQISSKDASASPDSLPLSKHEAPSPHPHEISSGGRPLELAESLAEQAHAPMGVPPISRPVPPRSLRPAGMPIAGTRDIMHLLQMQLHRDEQQTSQALERSKEEFLQQIRNLEHARSVAQSKLEVLESEKEQLLNKTRHDQEQISNLRKRSATLDNFVNGFSSDFNRLREDLMRTQSTCSQLMEDKGRQTSEKTKLIEHFNSNLSRSEHLHSEAKRLITALQTRMEIVIREKEMLESNLNEKVGMLAEQRDTCAKLQKHLEEVRHIPESWRQSVQSESQVVNQKLDELRVSVERIDIDEKIRVMVAECANFIRFLQTREKEPLSGIGEVHDAIGKLTSRQDHPF